MEEKLKIKISIADRVYPLTVESNLEEGLRSASKKIENMIKLYEENYAVRDKQDVLAMCALQFASAQENQKIHSTEEYEDAILRLKKINEKIDFVLNKNI
ncbi:cell division protein ZapA [Flavobacterium sp. I3-2]|uniref:cell division protein ZapA n=1 Tax=Flavobacterium sp. I3-2 TaxID=2748319 RepID=UPI0015B09DDC|nr:cell division protein ZapA [Flavobacterium sp. I3-2]